MKSRLFTAAVAGVATTVAASLAVPAANAAEDDPSTHQAVFTGATGSAAGATVGTGSCDVTGDGISDSLTTAWMWGRSGMTGSTNLRVGATYVIPGGEAHGGELDDPASGAIRIEGSLESTLSGFSASCAGDVNGDGIDDILIDNYMASRAYVVFGSTHLQSMSLDYLGANGFIIQGNNAPNDRTGYSMSSLGDLDGDGKGEIGVVSLTHTDAAGERVGKVTVVRGTSDIATVDLTNPSPNAVLATITGVKDAQLSEVFGVGDTNGDGTADIALGAYTAASREGVATAGRAWILTDAHGELSLGDDLAGTVVMGPERGRDRLGISIAALGDINGDGLADVAFGADGVHSDTSPHTGGVAVVLGSTSNQTICTDPTVTDGATVFACDASDTTRGWWITGHQLGDSTGYSIAGWNDGENRRLVIGAYGADPEVNGTVLENAGSVTAFDPALLTSRVGAVQLADLSDKTVQVWHGSAASQRLGRSVGVAGMQPLVHGEGSDESALTVVLGGDAVSATPTGGVTLITSVTNTATTAATGETTQPGASSLPGTATNTNTHSEANSTSASPTDLADTGADGTLFWLLGAGVILLAGGVMLQAKAVKSKENRA